MEQTAHLLDDRFCIPAAAFDLGGFRSWARSADFPEHGRIDFLGGDLEVDMSPEDLYTHGSVKAEVAAELQLLISRPGLGSVFIDRARVSSPQAGLSAEPDIVALFWSTVDRGQAREVPAAGARAGRFIEIEGAPDLVVEIVSEGSWKKDRERLPRLYAAAGIPELWLIDARGAETKLEIHVLGSQGYGLVQPAADGRTLSPLLHRRFALTRYAVRPNRWSYRLEHGPIET